MVKNDFDFLYLQLKTILAKCIYLIILCVNIVTRQLSKSYLFFIHL